MNEQQKAARREYMRMWRAKNRDKTKEYQERFWQKKAEAAEREKKDQSQIIAE